MVEEGRLRRFRGWPSGTPLGLALLADDPANWPWVEIVSSHAGARGDGVHALVAAGVHGLVVAATGNGTVHLALQAALDQAQDAGLPVWRASRCASGVLLGPDAGPAAAMTPWQARIELMLTLLLSARGGG